MPINILDRSGTILKTVDADTLENANLRSADLRYADLRSADLGSGTTIINWQSHELIAAILLRWAGDSIEKRSLAGLILVSSDWCWDKFLSLDHPLRAEALTELARWITGDDDAPQCVRDAASTSEATKETSDAT